MKKNDIISLEITSMTSEGNGVGHYEGMAIFVPNSALGDTIECKIVKMQKTYAYGTINNIINPSADRINSDCAVSEKCGGCLFRHISYNAELKIKEQIVYDAFTRIGKLTPEFEPILPCEHPDYYRNKAQYPVAEQNGKAICGFYSRRSHRVVPFTACKLQPKEFENIVNDIIEYVNRNNIPAYNEEIHKGALRHIYLRKGLNSGEIMVCFVCAYNINKAVSELCNQLTKKYENIKSIVININSEKTNVILGKKNITLYGNNIIYDIMCGNRIELSPLSFYQVNTKQAEKLYNIAKEYAQLNNSQTLLDLYCGTGTIGLSMAKEVKKLIGIEIIPQAIKNAVTNAKLNNIENAEFICGDAGEISDSLADEKDNPNIIIVDPPRKGCDKNTINAIIKMSPEKVVMISCNPATVARDCSLLESFGYKTLKVRAVDMFPRTGHVECVVLMSRK